MQITRNEAAIKSSVWKKIVLGRINRNAGLVALIIAALSFTGCMTGNAKRFFPDNKDIAFQKPVITLATPWGTETITADSVSSTVRYPLNTNAILVPTGYIPPTGFTLVPNSVFQTIRTTNTSNPQ